MKQFPLNALDPRVKVLQEKGISLRNAMYQVKLQDIKMWARKGGEPISVHAGLIEILEYLLKEHK